MIPRLLRPGQLCRLTTPSLRTTRPVFRGSTPRWPIETHVSRSPSWARSFADASRPAAGGGFPRVGDTIYAVSTAPGRAGIAVIRISGPSCVDVYKSLCPGKKLPKARYAAVRSLYRPSAPSPPEILDSEALVLYFTAPHTVTGEDVLELHVHGGPATVKAVLSAIPQCTSSPGAVIRYAEPGEFTKRAFLHDRLDLAQIESLSDTLAAETEQQRRAAVRGNSGALGKTYESWREKLLYARGEIEALIDFSEDQHFDESQSELLGNVRLQVAEIIHGIRSHADGSQKSELLRKGIRIALLGPPNAGKSSLMNLIVGREASIVSGEAGTTRDIVEASLDIRGYLCSFADTAGFRASDAPGLSDGDKGIIGAVETEGIRRAKLKARESDIVVVLASVEAAPAGPVISYDKETLDLAGEAQASLIIVNKTDAVASDQLASLIQDFKTQINLQTPALGHPTIIPISCLQAQLAASHPPTATHSPLPSFPSSSVSSDTHAAQSGLQSVVDALTRTFSAMTHMPVDQQDLLGVTERQRQLLGECQGHLEAFMAEAEERSDGSDADSVLAAEFLRYAADCLARITGKGESGDAEDVLGVVFEKFCVGK